MKRFPECNRCKVDLVLENGEIGNWRVSDSKIGKYTCTRCRSELDRPHHAKSNTRTNWISAYVKKNGGTRAEAAKIYDAQQSVAPSKLAPLWTIPMEQRSKRARLERSAPQRTFGIYGKISRRGRPYIGWGEGGTHVEMFTAGCCGTGKRDHGRDVENYRDEMGPEFEDKFIAEDVLHDYLQKRHRWSEWFNGGHYTRLDAILYMNSEAYRLKVLAHIEARNS